MNKLSAIILSAAIITLVHATPVHAMSIDNRTAEPFPTKEIAAPCIPYTHAMVAKGMSWSHTIELTHGDCDGQGTQVKSKTANNSPVAVEPVTSVPVVNTPIVHNNPAPVVKEDKPKCNNGEGNGSEGCSPAKSVNANNDENNTTPKEDKSTK